VTARLVISVHDVAPGSALQSRVWLSELDRRGVPASLLVVPGPWRGGALATDLEFAAFLRERADAGHDIVQHGWQHTAGADRAGWRAVTERALARGAGEFAAVSEQAAALRLRAGRAVLADAGLPTDGFTAPGWLHSPGTLRALKTLGFRYTTTHAGVLDLATGQRIAGPAFSHRPGGAGETLAAKLLVNGAKTVTRIGGLVRIALHPDDLSHPGLRTASLNAIDGCLAAGVQPTTYSGLLDSITAPAAA
jgi:predicted deacetylase